MSTPENSCFCDGGPSQPGVQTQAVSSSGPFFRGIKMSETPTPRWMPWGYLNDKGAKPAPTIIHFGGDIMNLLAREDFNKVGFILREHGIQSVATDSPCYVTDLKPGEKEGLPGWRDRIEKGEPFIADFASKTSHLLDHLIREGYTDPDQVIACGHCRGGFLALHWAALEPRVKCVLAFTPLTNPVAAREFFGMENHPGAKTLAIHHHVDKLADRAIWSCIGNFDDRVSTESCMSFIRKLMEAAVAKNNNKPADIEFHLSAVIGHATYAMAHEDAAAWVLAQLAKKRILHEHSK